MANAPLSGQDGIDFTIDLPDGLSGKFFAGGLDRNSGDLPVGLFCRAYSHHIVIHVSSGSLRDIVR